MRKSTVARTTCIAVLSFGFCASSLAQSMNDCTSDAGRSRYATEMSCYESYGPKSGNWTVQEQEPLNACLNNVNLEYSEEIAGCQDLYAVADDSQPLNAKKATTGALGIIGAIFGILAL